MGDCDGRTEISGAIGKIQGKLAVVLMLLVTLVGGVGYSIAHYHTLDKRLVIQEYQLSQKANQHEEHMDELRYKIDSLAGMCCGK